MSWCGRFTTLKISYLTVKNLGQAFIVDYNITINRVGYEGDEKKVPNEKDNAQAVSEVACGVAQIK